MEPAGIWGRPERGRSRQPPSSGACGRGGASPHAQAGRHLLLLCPVVSLKTRRREEPRILIARCRRLHHHDRRRAWPPGALRGGALQRIAQPLSSARSSRTKESRRRTLSMVGKDAGDGASDPFASRPPPRCARGASGRPAS